MSFGRRTKGVTVSYAFMMRRTRPSISSYSPARAQSTWRPSASPATISDANARVLLDGDFDMVYTTWGTITWLPDIAGWARVIASLLRPGSAFYFADSHPVTTCLEMAAGKLVPGFDWRTPPDLPLSFEEDTTYTGDETKLTNRASHNWIHPLSDILNSLISAGLRLDWLHEHEALTWKKFPTMEKGTDGLYRLPAGYPRLPLAISLMATRPA